MACLKRFLVTFFLFHILLPQIPWSSSSGINPKALIRPCRYLLDPRDLTSFISCASPKYTCFVPRPSHELPISHFQHLPALLGDPPSRVGGPMYGLSLDPLLSWAPLLFHSPFTYQAFLVHHILLVPLGRASSPFKAQALSSLSHGLSFLYVHEPDSLSHFRPQQWVIATLLFHGMCIQIVSSHTHLHK